MAVEREDSGFAALLPAVPLRVRSAVLPGLFVLAVLYTAHVAAPIAVPVAAALLLSFLFSPLVAAAVRKRIPRIVAAAAIVLTLLAALAGSAYWLAEPASNWLRAAPTSLIDLRIRLGEQTSALDEVREASEAVEEAVEELTGSNERPDRQRVEIREPGLLEGVMAALPVVLGGLAMTLFLTFLLLLSSDSFLRKLAALGTSFGARRRIVATARRIESQIARYLATVTMINAALGCVVAAVMHLLGVPNAALWGAVAGVLNFAPYVGPAVTIVILTFAGLSVFDSMGMALVPAALFFVITTLEGQVVTPLLLGQRLDLSPVVVFVSVVVFGWIWNVPGALMAVPIMATLKLCLDAAPRTRPLAVLLGR